MDNPEKMAGYTRRRGNQRWIIQRKWQHRVHKTKGQSKMDNPEKMAGYTRRRGNQRWTIQRKWQGTQDEGAIKDGQSKENGRVHKAKGQSKMDNPEKMAGYTRRRGNQRWTIQRKWQGTQDEGAIKDGQSRENGRVHKTKGQSKMDNPEKMAGYTRRRGNQRWTIQRKWQGTQDEGAIIDGQSRENVSIGYTRRRGNQRWTIQRKWHHRLHKTKKNKTTPLCTNRHK